jgi:molybdopterin molybdotransferase
VGRFEGLGRTEVEIIADLEPIDSYLAELLADVERLGAEEVDLGDALGRVLAEDVTAASPLPGFPNSAMDGYAVRAGDVGQASADAPALLEVIGEVAAGAGQPMSVREGTALRIMTGAPVPAGADAVVPVEVTTQEATTVAIHRTPAPGDHIRLVGEDVASGQRVLDAGTLIRPSAIAMIAAVGRASVRCTRRPRVTVISTGDELAPAGADLEVGELHDSNGPMLVALARSEGADASHPGAVRDDPDTLRKALADAAATSDLVLVSGGVSAGAHDHMPDVLASLGTCRRAKLAMKPGKPQLHGRIDQALVIGLPGNPVSSFVSFEVFALPVLRALLGRSDGERTVVNAVAVDYLRGAPGKRTFLRVRLRSDGDRLVVESTGGQGSHVISALARANALAEIPEDRSHVAAGDAVRVRVLTDLA